MDKIYTGKYGELLKRKDQKKGYTLFNNAVLFDLRLSVHDRLVFFYLLMRTYRGKTTCFPAVRTIAEELGISVGQVSKSTLRLKKLDYLDIEKGKRGFNIYKMKK